MLRPIVRRVPIPYSRIEVGGDDLDKADDETLTVDPKRRAVTVDSHDLVVGVRSVMRTMIPGKG